MRASPVPVWKRKPQKILQSYTGTPSLLNWEDKIARQKRDINIKLIFDTKIKSGGVRQRLTFGFFFSFVVCGFQENSNSTRYNCIIYKNCTSCNLFNGKGSEKTTGNKTQISGRITVCIVPICSRGLNFLDLYYKQTYTCCPVLVWTLFLFSRS